MKFKEEFIYKGDSYQILLCEKDNIISPEINEWILKQYDASTEGTVSFVLEDYELKLQGIEWILGNGNIQAFLEVPYSGGIILIKDFVRDYGNEEEYPCYCYKKVMEFIFEEGSLITSIDHSKAMVRIRKNIEKGLRDIHKKKDFRCIKGFIKESFVRDYDNTVKKNRYNRILLKLSGNKQ